MFYQIMKWYLGWMVKLYFRKIHSYGLELIPDGQPSIFASNHPAGFFEPIILATNARQPIHFLVLGSFLQSRWLQWFFRGVKMVPIYRADISGNKTIEKNKSTFNYVYNALEQNAHILIYPEAHTKFIYKQRPLKKGIARMSRGFLQRASHEKMFIIPVGVNFVYPTKWRSVVFFQVGEPICLDSTEGDENVWYSSLLKKTATQMSRLVFDVQDESRHATIQQLVEVQYNNLIPPRFTIGRTYDKGSALVIPVRQFVDRLDQMTDEDFETLRQKATGYFRDLKRYGLQDRTIAGKTKMAWWHFLWLVLGLFPALAGLLLHGFSLSASFLVKKHLVRKIEYKAAVAAGVTTVLTLIAVIVFLLAGLLWNIWWLAGMFLFPFSLYLLVYYRDLADLFWQRLRFACLGREKKSQLRLKRPSLASFDD